MRPDSFVSSGSSALAVGESEVHDPYRPSRVSHTCKKLALVVLIVALFFVLPGLGAFLTQLGLKNTEYVFLLTLSLLVHMWCRYDAAERGRAMNRSLSLGIALIVIAGFPQYLHDIRGYSYGRAIAIAVLWVVLYFVVAYAGINASVALF